jgi:Mg-chelatase subunit ChlD
MPIAPSTVFQAATLNAALPPFSNADYQAQRAVITNRINQLGSQPMMGATNLSAGLNLAVSHMTGPQASQLSNKVVILLTDGQWNEGVSPITAGAAARDAGVLVHAVSMLTNIQPDVRQMAEMTGGRYYLTQNEAELREAFRDLARSLQIVMIE